MADKRVIVTLGCTVCKDKNYHFQRGKKKDFKLELSKFCKACGKQTVHKEVK
jgi:large subunit ribosomal protein L33